MTIHHKVCVLAGGWTQETGQGTLVPRRCSDLYPFFTPPCAYSYSGQPGTHRRPTVAAAPAYAVYVSNTFSTSSECITHSPFNT